MHVCVFVCVLYRRGSPPMSTTPNTSTVTRNTDTPTVTVVCDSDSMEECYTETDAEACGQRNVEEFFSAIFNPCGDRANEVRIHIQSTHISIIYYMA
jgi:hypothetical protein